MRHLAAFTLTSFLTSSVNADSFPVQGQPNVSSPVTMLQCPEFTQQPMSLEDNITTPVRSFTPENFRQIVASVNDLNEYRTLLANFNITYPHILSARFNVARNDVGQVDPLVTINRGYAICRGFASLAVPFLENMPSITAIYPVHLQPKSDCGLIPHELTMFKTIDNHWGYVSNTTVTDPIYGSREEVIDKIVRESYTICGRECTFQGAIVTISTTESNGEEIYGAAAALFLPPRADVKVQKLPGDPLVIFSPQ